MYSVKKGFTLIEVLTVVVILSIVSVAMAFAVNSARASVRDQRRKADLAKIASGFEKYRSDCGRYPTASQYNSVNTGGNLVGSGATPACRTSNIYIEDKPNDPQEPTRVYSYNPNPSGASYVLCASLEGGGPAVSGCTASCGIQTCNYRVTNP